MLTLGADMRRRGFVLGLGGTAVWPLAARAQQAVPVIGYLSGRSPDAEAAVRVPFLNALEESGFVAGRNVAIEYRFSDGRDDRLPALAAEFVRRPVAVLVATDRPSAQAAKGATATIPIVFTSGQDPVQLGLVNSLQQPGGNATGVFLFVTELGPKRLGLLREMLPRPGLIAFVVNRNATATTFQVTQMQAAAQALAQPLLVLDASTPQEVEEAFAAMAQRNVVGVLYGAAVFFQVVSDKLIALAARHRIPAMYEWREFVATGGLTSYSPSRTEIGRQVGIYTGRILNGAKPADLPVVQSTRFEFAINLKTANALGLDVPPMLLARADEVIE
jgi:putative tryptophan/tyrosine transport system substrate-binding protein